MTKEQYLQFKNDGYYIRITKGKFKQNKVIEYSLAKDTSETERTIKCLLNLCAVRMLVKMFSFETKRVKDTIFLNYPESLDFNNRQLKEPLIITWYE
jgi:hypothetical protein